MKKQYIFILILVILVLGITSLAVWSYKKSNTDTNPALTVALNTTAQCLTDKGVKFYGAYWCPHCAIQKALFKTAVKKLPYVECADKATGGQTQICIDKGIKGYPTWIFPDNSQLSGENAPFDLATKAQCVLTAEDKTQLEAQKTEFKASGK